MIKLKEKWLLSYTGETLLDNDSSIEIFVNPSSSELTKYVATGARGYIDKYGNLYVEGYNEEKNSEILHLDLFEILPKNIVPKQLRIDAFYEENILDDLLKYGMCVTRENRTNKFYLAESYMGGDLINYQDEIITLLGLAKEKNPALKFYTYTR